MNVISKKDLLADTGISYGQLYRWKREGLIPEDWFIKQASFTGQETFFPREEILGRVSAILQMKDDHSLEELAAILSPENGGTVSVSRLKGLSDVGETIAAALSEIFGKQDLTYGETAFAAGIVKIANTAGIAFGEYADVIRQSAPLLAQLKVGETVCTLFSANGLHVCFSKGTERPVFDPGVTVYGVVTLGEAVNSLKMQLEGDRNAKHEA